MDYEKEYKKLKASIRGEYLYAQTDSTKAVLESILPELKEKEKEKENEDDRISNAIMCYITNYSDGCSMICVNGVTRSEAVAWLEKQGKQKPAWSEKDSLILDSIISVVEEWEDNRSEKEKEYYGKSTKSDWLKSLKGRVQPQPKQEWGEEDEKMLNSFLHKVEICGLLTNKENVWIVKKLKSLRPQQWKPSDEQIIALRWVLHNVPYCKYKEEISGLLDQLKKLKEEQL